MARRNHALPLAGRGPNASERRIVIFHDFLQGKKIPCYRLKIPCSKKVENIFPVISSMELLESRCDSGFVQRNWLPKDQTQDSSEHGICRETVAN